MPLIFRHFALVLILFTGINAVIAARRVPTFFATDLQAQTDAARFVWRVAALLMALFLVLEVLTVASRSDSPLCFLPLPGVSGTRAYIAWGMWIGWIGAVTLWVVFAAGADRVARFGPLFARGAQPGYAYNSRIVRLLTIVWCVGSLAIPLAMPKSDRLPMTCSDFRVGAH